MTNEDTLKNFMLEFFDFDCLVEMGVFTKDMKNDYKSQAEKICYIFGYKTIYEYGALEVRCHLSYVGERPLYVDENGKLIEEPFITEIKSIYE